MKLKSTLKVIVVMVIYFSFNSKVNATVHTVNVANFQFTPSTIPNVVVGDVIKWVWVSGSHTTTSTSVPVGADTWSSDIEEGSTTFEYTVTVAGTYNYWCIPHAPDMAGTFTAVEAGPVPVRLSEFKIVDENSAAILKWITLSEDNVDYFSVQKSKTGSDFTEIARVPAGENSSISKSYSYVDRNLSSSDKFYYYMISSVDKNGAKQFSSVQLFRNKANTSKLVVSMSPNPISRSGHLMLKFNADKPGKMDVNVINMEGKSVYKTSMQAFEGVNNGHLMLENLLSGHYSIIFKLNNVKETHEVIVE
jgi:plastocyanin